MIHYTISAPQGAAFVAVAARKGTKQAASRPLALVAPKGATVERRYIEDGTDPATVEPVVITSGRVQLSAAQTAHLRDAALAVATDEAIAAHRKEHNGTADEARKALAGAAFRAMLASGTITVPANEGAERGPRKGGDKTAAAIESLF